MLIQVSHWYQCDTLNIGSRHMNIGMRHLVSKKMLYLQHETKIRNKNKKQ